VLAGTAEGGRRRGRRAATRVGIAEVAPGSTIVGLGTHRRLQLLGGFREGLELERDEAEVQPDRRVLGRDLGGVAIHLAGLRETAELEAHQRQQLEHAQIASRCLARGQELGLGLGKPLRGHELARPPQTRL